MYNCGSAITQCGCGSPFCCFIWDKQNNTLAKTVRRVVATITLLIKQDMLTMQTLTNSLGSLSIKVMNIGILIKIRCKAVLNFLVRPGDTSAKFVEIWVYARIYFGNKPALDPFHRLRCTGYCAECMIFPNYSYTATTATTKKR